MAEEAEEDDCRPDVVELARTTVAALLSRVMTTEPTPDDTDAREDGRALWIFCGAVPIGIASTKQYLEHLSVTAREMVGSRQLL